MPVSSTLALWHHNVSTLSSTNRHRAVGAVRALDTAPRSREGTVARCELDSCVAGPNFRIDEYTGEHCNVTPYSTDYQPLKDIPIVNASTTYTDPDSEETILLRLNQVLWYGHRLAMSLINPNQIRHSGLTVSDNPTDKKRAFGISGRFLHFLSDDGHDRVLQLASTHQMGIRILSHSRTDP
jgi:hypothetical protein